MLIRHSHRTGDCLGPGELAASVDDRDEWGDYCAAITKAQRRVMLGDEAPAARDRELTTACVAQQAECDARERRGRMLAALAAAEYAAKYGIQRVYLGSPAAADMLFEIQHQLAALRRYIEESL